MVVNRLSEDKNLYPVRSLKRYNIYDTNGKEMFSISGNRLTKKTYSGSFSLMI